jgi:hypothetical protein
MPSVKPSRVENLPTTEAAAMIGNGKIHCGDALQILPRLPSGFSFVT